MVVVPIGDKVVVKRLESEQTSAGGIVLPDSAREKSQQGRVLAVGDGHPLPDGQRSELQVAEGDLVLFASYAGTEITLGDEEFLIISEADVLAVLD